MLDRKRLASHLQVFPRQTIPLGSLRPAAVLVPLFQRNKDDYLLFTERTAHLEHHAGEISFPGGGRDAKDDDLTVTALRETEEEDFRALLEQLEASFAEFRAAAPLRGQPLDSPASLKFGRIKLNQGW